MKRLLLLRHAKAVPHGTVNDFDRPLAERGRRDMAALAPRVAEKKPDLALVSPSARTRETWDRCALPNVRLRLEEAIYEASLGTLLGLVRALPDSARLPILVGHNPAFAEFATALGQETPLRGLPTAGLVLAEWPAAHWREVELAEGRLADLVTPDSIGAAHGA